jgi:outer membrane protein assembly factor BamB
MAGAVSDGVYVICAENLLIGLAIVDGAEVWRLVMPQSIVTPISAGEGLIFAGDTTGTFFAMEANSGVERWQFATANGIASAATVANGVVYVSSGGSLYALNTLAEDNVPVQ